AFGLSFLVRPARQVVGEEACVDNHDPRLRSETGIDVVEVPIPDPVTNLDRGSRRDVLVGIVDDEQVGRPADWRAVHALGHHAADAFFDLPLVGGRRLLADLNAQLFAEAIYRFTHAAAVGGGISVGVHAQDDAQVGVVEQAPGRK